MRFKTWSSKDRKQPPRPVLYNRCSATVITIFEKLHSTYFCRTLIDGYLQNIKTYESVPV